MESIITKNIKINDKYNMYEVFNCFVLFSLFFCIFMNVKLSFVDYFKSVFIMSG